MVIIEQFFSKDEVHQYRFALKQVPWNDGKQTAMGMAADVKQNGQADANDAQVQQLANGVLAKMGTTPKLVSAALPHKIFPPCFNRYSEHETYGFHVDAAIMRLPNSQDVIRSDMSMTLFLSEPDEYQGGELVIATEFGEHRVKCQAGDAIVYPSSSLHKVTPVTQGTRIAAITWMQSLVTDQSMRQTLFQLDQTIQSLAIDSNANRQQLDNLHHVYHNLIRQFSQV
ncbi:Fe2+-dependent dioxygenase [Paraneptunicella aestuarii]|uniref:Fe2+-dependent dioxygenase n=1 Tax=Paraneptunicella aestuarii TaxID=2831148 RepID=UPI001E549BB6|nr:Fe2+-dependent dioxygenase [Paraneptunicella aestuarii]UAA40639.1 Fe2+-dependent dioxygenase [Paraneptunicella aestuarii]